MTSRDRSTRPSRREFFGSLAYGAVATLSGCRLFTLGEISGGGSARLGARPHAPSQSIAPGSHTITPENPRDGFLVVPSGYSASRPMPFMLALHGAGGTATGALNLMGAYGESHGFIILAPGARGATWDAITNRYNYDVAFIDGALSWAFDRCAVDPARMIVQGFSDGASYALGLGVANGDLFRRTIAFSPGFVPKSDSTANGRSEFFISHGTEDTVLPIDRASRLIVPGLRSDGYDVTYTEFAGVHEVPAAIAEQGVAFGLR
jgi:predicted esterase